MHMAVRSGAAAAAASAAAEQRVASKAAPGRLVSGTVTHASPLVADVRLESGERARLHVTEWRDPQSGPNTEQPGACTDCILGGRDFKLLISSATLYAAPTSHRLHQQLPSASQS